MSVHVYFYDPFHNSSASVLKTVFFSLKVDFGHQLVFGFCVLVLHSLWPECTFRIILWLTDCR